MNLSLVIIGVCVIMSAYFSATETAFSSFNRIRVKNMAEKGDKKAELVMRLSEDYDSLLSTILIGNNIVNIALSSLATVLFIDWVGAEAGPSVSTIVVTIVVLIFGEVSPKSIAKEKPESFAMFSAPFLQFLVIILTPFNYLFGLWKKVLSKIIKSENSNSITEEELLTIVAEAEQEGGIDEQESILIRSAIVFSEQEAKDILTPRIDVVGVSTEDTKEEIAQIFVENGYSRLPVYEDNIDNIVGILYQKDFYNYIYHTDNEVSSIIKPAVFIPESKNIGELLKELQQKKSHIAVVLDEYGGTTGIVTMEDILEELVGEIWDEHDEVTREIERVSENEYAVLGSTSVEDLFEMLDKDLDEDIEVLTVSGWVMNVLGKIPEKGDEFRYENLKVKVLEMDAKRVEKIQIIIENETDREEEKE